MKDFWDDCVEHPAEVQRQDLSICSCGVKMLQDIEQHHVDSIIHSPVCLVCKFRGHARVLQSLSGGSVQTIQLRLTGLSSYCPVMDDYEAFGDGRNFTQLQ